MATIEDLGRLMKAKYPGKFDHRTDREVGLELKTKYPSRFLEYRDPMPERSEALVPTVSAPISKRESSKMSYADIIRSIAETDSSLAVSIESEVKLSRNIESLVEYYKPDRGVFTSWWHRRKAEGREKFLDALNREQQQLIEQTIMLQRAAHEDRTRRAELNVFIARNAFELMELKLRISLTEQAEEMGMTPADFSSLNKERVQGEIRANEYERKVLIDYEVESKKRREAIDFALEHEHLAPHQEIRKLQAFIDSVLQEISDIEYDPLLSETSKYSMIRDREQTLNAYREDKRARESRLLQNHNG